MEIKETLERSRWRRLVRTLDRHLSALDPIFVVAILGIFYTFIQVFLLLNSTTSADIPASWRHGLMWLLTVVTVVLVGIGCIRQFARRDDRGCISVEKGSWQTLFLRPLDLGDLIYSSNISQSERERQLEARSNPEIFHECGSFFVLHVRNNGDMKLTELGTTVINKATGTRVGRYWARIENQIIIETSVVRDLSMTDSADLVIARWNGTGWSEIETEQDNCFPTIKELSYFNRDPASIKSVSSLALIIEFGAENFRASEEFLLTVDGSGKPSIRIGPPLQLNNPKRSYRSTST